MRVIGDQFFSFAERCQRQWRLGGRRIEEQIALQRNASHGPRRFTPVASQRCQRTACRQRSEIFTRKLRAPREISCIPKRPGGRDAHAGIAAQPFDLGEPQAHRNPSVAAVARFLVEVNPTLAPPLGELAGMFASLAEVSVKDLEGMALKDYTRLQAGYFRLVQDDEL